MCVLWFWAEGRRSWELQRRGGLAGNHQISAPLTSSTRWDLHDTGPGDLQLWSRVTPGWLKSMGEAYQEQ